ncbi:hypothetical protein pb186bvf_006930 [Paramecium bursaria]
MPPKHKGVSLQEKRDRILRIFTEKKEVFSLGQIEKEAEKAGIRRDQVKDLLEALVSDTLVEVDTIGTSKVYWSLPSQTLIKVQQRCQYLDEQIELGKQQLIDLKQQEESSSIDRQPCKERVDLENNIYQLKIKTDKLEQEIKKLERFDPERIQKLEKEMVTLNTQALQSQEDIFQLVYYLKTQGAFTDSQLLDLGIPKQLQTM